MFSNMLGLLSISKSQDNYVKLWEAILGQNMPSAITVISMQIQNKHTSWMFLNRLFWQIIFKQTVRTLIECHALWLLS